MVLTRTAKSCRSDAPKLASSLREEAQATVSNKRGHREEREVSRKTIARGMPGETGVTVVTNSYAFLFCMRGCGCIERPAFPAPSDFWANSFAQPGRIAPRDRGELRSRCAAALQEAGKSASIHASSRAIQEARLKRRPQREDRRSQS